MQLGSAELQLERFRAGAGELHLEICLNDLQGEYMGGAAINVSDPVVSYRETVTDRSNHTVMAKSPNKHNRIYLEGRPLEDGLAEKIDDGDIGPQVFLSARCRLSAKEWCVGIWKQGARDSA